MTARIVLGLVAVLGPTLGTVIAVQTLGQSLLGPSPSIGTQRLVGIVFPLLLAVVVFGSYVLYSRALDGQWPTDLRRVHVGRDLLVGTALGAGLFTLALGVVWAAGSYSVLTVNPVWVVLPAVTGVVFFVGIEEVVNRGIILPELESQLGSWVALAISSAFFASYHVVLTANPSPTAVGVILAAGILMGIAYLATRQLWLPMAFHAGWNFTQGAIFGIEVSGNDVGNVALLVGRTDGPVWLTGGSYGLEGSLVALTVLAASVVVAVWYLRQSGQIRPRSAAGR